MYCSGQVPFLPSLSLKILVGEGRIPGQARSRFSLLQEGSSEKFCPSDQPWSYSFAQARFLQALANSAHMSFADFTDRYGLHSLRSGGAPSLPRRVFLIIFSRLMELGDLARPCTHTLRGLLPINCFQPGPCTTEPRL